MLRRRVVVHGSVQGVGVRYSARLAAQRRGAPGSIRNRPDGAVEAEIEGDEAAVQAMLDWLATGPRGAGVERIEVADAEPLGEPGFRVIG